MEFKLGMNSLLSINESEKRVPLKETVHRYNDKKVTTGQYTRIFIHQGVPFVALQSETKRNGNGFVFA
jgi:hypothetical protein